MPAWRIYHYERGQPVAGCNLVRGVKPLLAGINFRARIHLGGMSEFARFKLAQPGLGEMPSSANSIQTLQTSSDFSCANTSSVPVGKMARKLTNAATDEKQPP